MKRPPLSESHPELAAQADGWDPAETTAGSNTKRRWICSLGHPFEASPGNRALRGTGCPYCRNTRVLPGFNDLKTKHPDIAVQADGWDPSLVLPGSDKKMAWRCEFGHPYAASIGSRAIQGTGCPYCAGRKVLAGFNDLATTDPELAGEADGWDASTVSRGSGKIVKWVCPDSHDYKMKVNERVRGYGCPICSSHRIIPGVNDLVSLYPEIAAQADGWDPSGCAPATTHKRSWRCELNHPYVATIASRTRQGTGCPYCANSKALPGFNDLATKYPHLVPEANGWDPSGVLPGSDAKVKWICPNGHTYEAVINSRTLQGTGCPYCSGRLATSGHNDLETTYPHIAAEAIGWDPSRVSANSSQKKTWLCGLGHEYVATVANRTRQHSGCPYCANQKVLVGFNDLATHYPQIALSASGWNPQDVVANSTSRKLWGCPAGHTYTMRVYDRVKGKGCIYCSSSAVLAGFNDLQTKYPDVATQLISADPKTILPNSNKKFWWRCEEEHEWQSTPNNRVQGRGCPSCAKSGFDPNKQGYLYFLRHDSWSMLQIGITNDPKKRLSSHKSLGWEVIELRGPMPGDVTRGWEQSILKALRRRNAIFGPDANVEAFDGYTEAWMTASWPATALKDLMDIVHEDESS